jgi:hypothetical protein
LQTFGKENTKVEMLWKLLNEAKLYDKFVGFVENLKKLAKI